MSLLRNTPGSAANTQPMVETCARASLAATWYTLAVNALLIKKSTVAELYKLAAQLAVVVDTDGHGQPLQHSKTDAQAQLLGDKAGLRYAEAAQALAARDCALHLRCLQAAEATARLVTVSQKTSRTHVPRRIAFSEEHSAAAVQEADRLKAPARALLDAQPQKNGRGKRAVDSEDDDGGAELALKRKKGNQGASG
jgi:hypothetical protein